MLKHKLQEITKRSKSKDAFSSEIQKFANIITSNLIEKCVKAANDSLNEVIIYSVTSGSIFENVSITTLLNHGLLDYLCKITELDIKVIEYLIDYDKKTMIDLSPTTSTTSITSITTSITTSFAGSTGSTGSTGSIDSTGSSTTDEINSINTNTTGTNSTTGTTSTTSEAGSSAGSNAGIANSTSINGNKCFDSLPTIEGTRHFIRFYVFKATWN